MSHRRITDVSSPPEYASATLFTFFMGTSFLGPPARSARAGPTIALFARQPGRRSLCSRGRLRCVLEPAAEQLQDDALLCVQTVLGLVEDHTPRPVRHGIGDLFPTVRRQAVHDECAWRGKAEQSLAHLVALERL